jgi:hypothetical protein
MQKKTSYVMATAIATILTVGVLSISFPAPAFANPCSGGNQAASSSHTGNCHGGTGGTGGTGGNGGNGGIAGNGGESYGGIAVFGSANGGDASGGNANGGDGGHANGGHGGDVSVCNVLSSCA